MLSRIGFLIFLSVMPGVLLAVAAADLVGYYLNEFMIAYPWFATILAVIFGAMVAHFFLHITNG